MPGNLETAKTIEALADVIHRLPLIGATVYANGLEREKPIVDRHFTAGNQGRYGWAPLTRPYFLRKQGRVEKNKKGGVYYPGGGKKGSKIDKAAGFRSDTGTMSGEGTAPNAPMLVLSGLSRQAVGAGNHRIVQEGDMAWITFVGLPDYDVYLHEGTDRMPKRSPVEPSTDDVLQIEAEMEKALDAAIKAAEQAVPQVFDSVPGLARIV